MTTALARPTPANGVHGHRQRGRRSMSRTPEGLHQKAVEQAKEAIRDGEGFRS